jgi:hypothetical protein
MKIANANVSMQSQHVMVVHREQRESLRAWVGARAGTADSRQQGNAQVQVSAAGRAAYAADTRAAKSSTDQVDNDPYLALIRAMIERLTGRQVRVFDASALSVQVAQAAPATPAPSQSAPTASQGGAGFGVQYDYHAVYEEAEQTSFSAQGVVHTADGQTIQFQLDLSMARQYREQTDVSLRVGDAQKTDPLVINFAGNAAQLTDQRFAFDLNSDGSAEQLPMLAAGSGYLALDGNGNGSIDSGAELFGPTTGSGFGELAALDTDHNQWIDENDPAFAQLRVWTPDDQGGATTATLQELQVGALYLGVAQTPFSLRGANNADLGAVSATGVYLGESGQTGTLQEVDLTV